VAEPPLKSMTKPVREKTHPALGMENTKKTSQSLELVALLKAEANPVFRRGANSGFGQRYVQHTYIL